MFGSLLKLGGKLLGGMRLGSKFIGNAGRLGTKVVQGANKAINMATGLPIVGHAIGQSNIVQGLRGVVGGLGSVADATTAAGDVLEKGLSGNPAAMIQSAGRANQVRGAFRKGRKDTAQGFRQTKMGYMMDKAKLKSLFHGSKNGPAEGTRHF